ncbi:MAG: hypothetical protein H0T92_11245 [Pyrinomonadaceae bacterium]|nr:hypothetical protein [Pyrinomonadaceae bacterium]
MPLDKLIYNWNQVEPTAAPTRRIRFEDETLRDGLQSPSVCEPPIERKLELLHLMPSALQRVCMRQQSSRATARATRNSPT